MTNVFIALESSLNCRGQRFIKEVGVASATEDCVRFILDGIFSPPHPWYLLNRATKCTNNYIERHVHGLGWNSGDFTQQEVIPALRSCIYPSDIIVTKGTENALFLHKALDCSVFDLNEWNPPLWRDLPPISQSVCDYPHRPETGCAAVKALTYATWLEGNLLSYNEFLP